MAPWKLPAFASRSDSVNDFHGPTFDGTAEHHNRWQRQHRKLVKEHASSLKTPESPQNREDPGWVEFRVKWNAAWKPLQ
jgi:hypothetical protein